jgi:hypothetical protein
LAGKDGASKLEVLDAMIANWMTDPVHGDKAGYARVAVKLIEKMEEKSSALPTPEAAASGGPVGSLLATSGASGSGSGRGRGRGANDTGPAAPSRLATSSTRVASTAATAVTGGTWLPTSSLEEGTAVDADADAAAPAAAATSRRLLSTNLRTICPCFFLII